MTTRSKHFLLICAFIVSLAGCSLSPSKSSSSTVKVTVSPATVNLVLGVTQQFTATVTGTTDTRVLWAVGGVAGGNATLGTISASGLYTPPTVLPNPSSVTVTATSMADTKVSFASSVSLTKPVQGIKILVTPQNTKLVAGTTQQYAATVTGTADHRVIWWVDGHQGGNSTFGTIDANGLYTAPITAPNPATVEVVAVSVADPKILSGAYVNVQSLAIVIHVEPSVVTVNLAQTQQFTATVTGTSNTKVTWAVNGTAGGNATIGTIDANGLYRAPAILPNPSTVNVTAISAADTHFMANSQTTIFNPNPLVSDTAAARFLEQASWGPTTATVARVKQIGFSAYLDEQFNTPPSSWPELGAKDGLDKMQKQFFKNAVGGQDQLRQRVAFAFGEIMVISNHKIDPQGFPYYVRTMHQDAFSNYVTLLKDVTLSPAMGHYLDMVDNDKADPNNGTTPNENYAREIMQLFSVGLVMLNPDGTLQTDASNNPIPTYTQNTIEGFSSTFTGWTYPTAPGQKKQLHNPTYWIGPMESDDSDHESGTKLLLGGAITPAGQTAAQDLDTAMQNILNHQNVGPFICQRLIEQLVTSNPSPTYLTHCSTVFADNGSGTRGDLKAVVKTILLDPEARRGDDPTQLAQTDGKMREPLVYMTGVLRGLNATTDGDSLNWFSYNMRQDLYNPASVFNYYPPNYRLSSNSLLAPELKIYTTPTALWRANFVNSIVYWNWPGTTTFDLTQWSTLAADNNKLLDALNVSYMHGAMPQQMRDAITTALNALDPTDVNGRARAAIYLVTTSQIYFVQH